MHPKYVTGPVDKVPGNVTFIYQRFKALVVVKELRLLILITILTELTQNGF